MESKSLCLVSIQLLLNSGTVPSLPKVLILEKQQTLGNECSVSISMASEEFLNLIYVGQNLRWGVVQRLEQVPHVWSPLSST